MNKVKRLTLISLAIMLVLDIILLIYECVRYDALMRAKPEIEKIVVTVNEMEAQLEAYEAELKEKDELIDTYERQQRILQTQVEYYKQFKEDDDCGITLEPGPQERLPEGPTNTMRGMDYRKITNTRSDQYILQQSCWTNEDGIRTYDGYLCVALGSAYGRDIGDTWHVTLECGTEFDIILSDFKDDGTTDFFGHPDKNYDGEDVINIIEFVMDDQAISEEVRNAGTFTVLDKFGGLHGHGGNIVLLEYTGQVWERS